MKRSFLALTAGVLCSALAAHSVAVDGYAFLSGLSDHEGIKVLFDARSPSAETDSVYTGSTGYFWIELEPGVYDVEYDYYGYSQYVRRAVNLLYDRTLESVTLMMELRGVVEGILGPGDFEVTDTIRVRNQHELRILPGTRLFFNSSRPFLVEGRLVAVGSEQDSIVMTWRYPTNRWQGVWFYRSMTGCSLAYCVVEHAFYQGALYIEESNPAIWRCTIQENDGNNAGAIFSFDGGPSISECVVRNNHGYYGAGFACTGGSPTISESVIRGNQAEYAGGGLYLGSGVVVSNCLVDSNTGGGVHLSGNAVMNSCVVRANDGTGVTGSGSRATISKCTIVGGETRYDRTVQCSYNDAARFEQCTILGTSGGSYGGVYIENASPTFNTCAIAAVRGGAAIYFSSSREAMILYSNIFSTSGNSIRYSGDDSTQGPTAIGIVALTNANGDSCDTYYNIFLDPQLVDTAAGDYHLRATSPCIDAGDPLLPADPDGSIADMGAFYFDQLGAGDRGRNELRRYGLLMNYPNPFNSTTRIVFELPRAGEVTLDVFDVLGRRVETVFAGPVNGGYHEVSFDARRLPSGVYVYHLRAGGFSEARKMMVVR